MFQIIRDLYSRHKRKFLVTTGVACVTYFISIYAKRKIKEFQDQLREENTTRELIKKRFAQTQKDCYMTFLSFLPVLVEPIFNELNVDQITKELRLIKKNRSTNNANAESGDVEIKSDLNTRDIQSDLNTTDLKSDMQTNDIVSNTHTSPQDNASSLRTGFVGEEQRMTKKTKPELWQDLKIKSLTKLLTLVYSESLLIILLHLQLNIISRKSYLKTALRLASKNHGIQLYDLEKPEEDYGDHLNDEELSEQAFLSYTWWLLNKGWIQLKDIVEESVVTVFKDVSLREELTVQQFGDLVFDVQKLIDGKLLGPIYANDSVTADPAIVSILLPSFNDEFEVLRNTSTIEFLNKFNSNVSNMETLQKMMGELTAYLRSEQVSNITKTIVTIGIASVIDSVGTSLLQRQVSRKEAQTSVKMGSNETKDAITAAPIGDAEKITNSQEPGEETLKWKLALILTVLGAPMNELTNRRFDNHVLYQMNNLPELDDLSASVYSNFDF